MSELKKYKLGDLGFFFGGVTSIKKEDYGHGTPFLPYKNVYKNSKVNVNELELMNVRPLDLERRNAVYGDIFFTASSETPDEVAMSSVLLDEVENLTFNGFCKRFRLNDFNTLLPVYARYLFRDISFRREVYQLATGDIRFNISQESLANIEIEIPDTATQKQIAQILSSLDDKIELNLQMNQTLEAMAQAIFKEWFVNFNFPGFDGELVDGLPKGWRMGKLGDISKNFDSKRIPLSSRQRAERKGEYPYYGAASILDYVDDFIFDGTYLLMGEDGTVRTDEGFPVLQYVWGKFWVNNHTHVLQGLFPFSTEYLYLFLAQTNITNLITGAVQPKINQGNMNKIKCVLPTEDVLNKFYEVINPIFDKLKTNSLQIQSLTQTRDTLLPKLMSGQLEVV